MTALMFIIPGVFYYQAETKFGSGENTKMSRAAIAFAAWGVFVTVFTMVNIFANLG